MIRNSKGNFISFLNLEPQNTGRRAIETTTTVKRILFMAPEKRTKHIERHTENRAKILPATLPLIPF